MQDGSTQERIAEESSPGELVEILATTSDLVPTASGQLLASHRTAVCADPEVDWRTAMKRSIRSAAQLRQILGLPKSPQAAAEGSFPTFVPLEFARRIRHGDADDPLLRQVLPVHSEDVDQAGFSADPVGDINATVAGSCLHKYHGRVLIISTSACGVHCRYCFRREYPYTANSSRRENFRPAIDYIRSNEDVAEVLLSGGDPLTMVDEQLDDLITQIESIPHVRRLRIHSRMPIVIPQRITPALVDRLRRSRLAVWMVVHANHPQELDESVFDRLSMLIDSGIPVLNQAVLLRGINDDAETLVRLCQSLVDHRVTPYYLHQLDRVRGASHFEVPVEQGKRLIGHLRQSLPGYAVPTYVVEEPGRSSKTPLT